MGVYSEYLETFKNIEAIHSEREKQIKRIAELRGRDVLTIATDMSGISGNLDKIRLTSIDYTDLLPISDQLDNFSGKAIDIILETPGGIGERAEDIVRMLRDKYNDVAFIIPGAAMSAGTIMAMAGDEILMDTDSSLGPIDAQLVIGGKQFAAEAFLDGFKRIKEEVEKTNSLNRAYIPMLQQISPSDIQACINAQDFARKLVSNWLVKWKFKNWVTHSSTGKSVTEAQRRARARSIASKLCKHSYWLTHGRSIKMDDLKDMGLKVTDYRQMPKLHEAIRRYYTLLRMTFESTPIFKLYETPDTRIYRVIQIPQPIPPPLQQELGELAFKCTKCGKESKIQVNLGPNIPLKAGNNPFPPDNKFKCPGCGHETDLTEIRQKIEREKGRKIVC